MLDACCLLNCIATARCETILRAPQQGRVPLYGIAQAVANEARYLQSGHGEKPEEREIVDLEPLYLAGVLSRFQFENAGELELFIEWARRVDDGEAATIAIALSRGYGIVTDDKKIRRLIAQETSGVLCRSTLELFKSWHDQPTTERAELSIALRAVRDRARYVPPRSDPLYSWWRELMD